MCGGGGSGGQLKPMTTSTTTADPRAQAMYQQAFGTAQQASQTPFMRYSTDPRAFVAQLTPTQQQAISNIAQSQGVYQPYYGAAAQLAGGSGTTSTADIVGQYMSPYMSQVVDPVRAALQQQQGMQLSQQQTEAIKGGAFGGERAGLQRAALRGQQQLGLGQALSPLYQTGYGQALGAAQGDLARQLQAGQVMGGLGTGAQQAAMQGAQGLLGAGTLEQQTQQAGLQSLYNQYLMERGYPFQTSQFLTSAAAGLGPLYGGTTTEQQATNPFGMFLSDPRAKTGVDRDEPDVVGKLNDGQNVYAYKYASGGPAQIGLMADEVAQRYPDAVGQRPDGLMAVDYGRATEVPAAMSHGLGQARMGGAVTDGGDYARGGYASGGDIDEIVARHKAALAAGVPTKMDIPIGAVQASQGLQPAKMSGAQRQQQKGLLDAGIEFGEKAGKAYGLAKNIGSALSDSDLIQKAGKSLNIGGYFGSSPFPSKYAYGGTPSIEIPTEAIHASRGLEPARISGSGREEEDDGFLGGLSKAADIGSKLAGIGSLAMKAAPFVMSLSDPRAKTGVRHGYADRGAVPTEDDIFERGLLGAESAHRQFDREGRTLTSPKGALGIAQIMPGTAPEAARLAGLEYDPTRLRQDPEYNKALGKAYFEEQRRRFGSDELAAAAYNAGPGRVQQALRQAEATGRDVMSFLPAETRAYVPKVVGRGAAEGQPLAYTSTDRPGGEGGLGAINRATDRGSLRAEAPPPAEAGLGAAKTPGGEPGFMDKYMKEEYVVPGLIGLAGAVEGALSAPTTSLGAALARGAATGVGAGAKAYEDIQTALPTREKTKAEAGKERAETGRSAAETLGLLNKLPIVDGPGGMKLIRLENGSYMNFADWVETSLPVFGTQEAIAAANQVRTILKGGQPGAAPPSGGMGEPLKTETTSTESPPAPQEGTSPQQPILAPSKIAPPVGVATGAIDKSEEMRAASSIGSGNPTEDSRNYMGKLNQAADSALGQRIYNSQVAKIVANANAAPAGERPGLLSGARATAVNFLNTLARNTDLKFKDGTPLSFGNMETNQQLLEKINRLRAEGMVTSGNQTAVASLNTMLDALPNLNQSPEAMATNAADGWMQNQRLIDLRDHANYYGSKTGRLFYLHPQAFQKAGNDDVKYAREEDALKKLMLDPHGAKIIEMFQHGRLPDGKPLKDRRQIDQYFSEFLQTNVPGISRYFIGAR